MPDNPSITNPPLNALDPIETLRDLSTALVATIARQIGGDISEQFEHQASLWSLLSTFAYERGEAAEGLAQRTEDMR